MMNSELTITSNNIGVMASNFLHLMLTCGGKAQPLLQIARKGIENKAEIIIYYEA